MCLKTRKYKKFIIDLYLSYNSSEYVNKQEEHSWTVDLKFLWRYQKNETHIWTDLAKL